MIKGIVFDCLVHVCSLDDCDEIGDNYDDADDDDKI